MTNTLNIFTSTYAQLKEHYDNHLNLDKSTYKCTNDVPTPIGCIEEVMSHVPATFWARTDTVILDPCCGNGNWHLVAWNLMNQHQQGTNAEEISRQFIFNDTNMSRLEHVKAVFGEQAHVTQQDFLEAYGDNNSEPVYDMVFANPPYAKFMKDGARASKNHTLDRKSVV